MNTAKLNIPGVQLAFVDCAEHDGELIKETFDIEKTPSAIFVKNGMYYQLAWNSENIWEPSDFLDFIEGQHLKSSIKNRLRSRVRPGISLYKEYIAQYLAEHYFDDIIPQTILAKNLFKNYTGYEIDLKSLNKDFGKKNKAKKS